jgi:xylulokinase
MSSGPLLVGVDVGTTNIKAVIFEPDGWTVAQASVRTPAHRPQPAWAYYDPEELFQSTAEALRQATGQLDDAGRIVSVAVASMGETGVPLDTHGQPTYEAMAWFDQRTRAQFEWLERTVGGDRLFAITGLSLKPIFGLCKLLWFKQNQPEAFARTVRWLNVADYVAYRLSNVPATDYSLASRTLALDLHRLRWATELIREVGLSPDLFAPLRPSGTRLGPVTPEAAGATGLPASAQVAVGGHDHVCGALAAGVVEPGVALDSMGTAEALCIPLAQPITDPALGRQGYTQGAHVVAGRYYVFGGQSTSGASVEWWREVLGEEVGYAALIAEAEQVPPGSLGVCFLPHLRRANPPHRDPQGCGAFIGLSTDAGRGVLFRAILEGLAYESRHTLEPLLEYPGVAALRDMYAIGGNTRNHLLMQIKATVLNRTITVIKVTEATSLGAAVLGGLAVGVYADVSSALGTVCCTQTPVEPVPDQVALYEAIFRQVYQRIYPSLRSLHHTIHRLKHAAW